jgi:hypothetical protein
VYSPRLVDEVLRLVALVQDDERAVGVRGVAVHVASEKQILKPVFSFDRFIGYGFETRRLSSYGSNEFNVQSPTWASQSRSCSKREPGFRGRRIMPIECVILGTLAVIWVLSPAPEHATLGTLGTLPHPEIMVAQKHQFLVWG